MDYLNYFGFEDFIRGVLDIALFVLLVFVYKKIRRVDQRNSAIWVSQLTSFLEMLIATIVLPVLTAWVSLLVLEDLAEEYAGIIFILSFYPPLAASLYYLHRLSSSAKQNA